MTTRARFGAADGCYLVGGAALVASAFLDWVARGPGSALRGHDLVDTVVALGNTVPALSASRLTIVWYLVPALGATSWLVFGLAGQRDHRATRVVAAAALAASVLAFAAFAALVGVAKLGWGPKLALAGGVGLCAGAWLPDARVRKAGSRPGHNDAPRARSSVVRAGDS